MYVLFYEEEVSLECLISATQRRLWSVNGVERRNSRIWMLAARPIVRGPATPAKLGPNWDQRRFPVSDPGPQHTVSQGHGLQEATHSNYQLGKSDGVPQTLFPVVEGMYEAQLFAQKDSDRLIFRSDWLIDL